MNKITQTIVTAGAKGADIDVFACAVAYAELLRLEGHEATPVIADSFTSSVTPSILKWGAEYKTEYEPDGSENFVLVDISDPDDIKFVSEAGTANNPKAVAIFGVKAFVASITDSVLEKFDVSFIWKKGRKWDLRIFSQIL